MAISLMSTQKFDQNRAVLMDQILEAEALPAPLLKLKSLKIMRSDPSLSNCFQVDFQLNNGKTFTAPFWADISLGKWCFRNGDPAIHVFNHLEEMLPEMLHHLEKGHILSAKSSLAHVHYSTDKS